MRILLRIGKGKIVLALISFILQCVRLFLGYQYDMEIFLYQATPP